jgi:hypothetical protein
VQCGRYVPGFRKNLLILVSRVNIKIAALNKSCYFLKYTASLPEDGNVNRKINSSSPPAGHKEVEVWLHLFITSTPDADEW